VIVTLLFTSILCQNGPKLSSTFTTKVTYSVNATLSDEFVNIQGNGQVAYETSMNASYINSVYSVNFGNDISKVTIFICSEESTFLTYYPSNSSCDIQCCNGITENYQPSPRASTEEFLWSLLNEVEDKISNSMNNIDSMNLEEEYETCACFGDIIPFSRTLSYSERNGTCTYNSVTGSQWSFTLDLRLNDFYSRYHSIFCLSSDTTIPYYFTLDVSQQTRYVTDLIAIYLEFEDYQTTVDPNIFDPPAQCDCVVQN